MIYSAAYVKQNKGEAEIKRDSFSVCQVMVVHDFVLSRGIISMDLMQYNFKDAKIRSKKEFITRNQAFQTPHPSFEKRFCAS